MIIFGWIFLFIFGAMASFTIAVLNEYPKIRKIILAVFFLITLIYEAMLIYDFHKPYIFLSNRFHIGSFISYILDFGSTNALLGILPLIWIVGLNWIINKKQKEEEK